MKLSWIKLLLILSGFSEISTFSIFRSVQSRQSNGIVLLRRRNPQRFRNVRTKLKTWTFPKNTIKRISFDSIFFSAHFGRTENVDGTFYNNIRDVTITCVTVIVYCYARYTVYNSIKRYKGR